MRWLSSAVFSSLVCVASCSAFPEAVSDEAEAGVPSPGASASGGASPWKTDGGLDAASEKAPNPPLDAAVEAALDSGTEPDTGAIDPGDGTFCGDSMTPHQLVGKYGYIESVEAPPESSVLRIVKIVLRSNEPYQKDGIFTCKDFTDNEARSARCNDEPATTIREGTNYLCGDLSYAALVGGTTKEYGLGAICGVAYAGQDDQNFATFYVTVGIGGIANGADALENKVDAPPHAGSEKMVFLKSQNCDGVEYIHTKCGRYVSGQ